MMRALLLVTVVVGVKLDTRSPVEKVVELIEELEADIAENNEAMKKLTAIREKENSDYQQEKAEMETALSSLHAAIEVLSGAGTGGDTGLLVIASKVRSAILNSPHMDDLSLEKSKLLKGFLENPVSLLQGPSK